MRWASPYDSTPAEGLALRFRLRRMASSRSTADTLPLHANYPQIPNPCCWCVTGPTRPASNDLPVTSNTHLTCFLPNGAHPNILGALALGGVPAGGGHRVEAIPVALSRQAGVQLPQLRLEPSTLADQDGVMPRRLPLAPDAGLQPAGVRRRQLPGPRCQAAMRPQRAGGGAFRRRLAITTPQQRRQSAGLTEVAGETPPGHRTPPISAAKTTVTKSDRCSTCVLGTRKLPAGDPHGAHPDDLPIDLLAANVIVRCLSSPRGVVRPRHLDLPCPRA